MKADPILEEVWRIKDKLSHEMAADPAAYAAKLDVIAFNGKGLGANFPSFDWISFVA